MTPRMAPRAIVLLSGGLDSMLAVRILQVQGLEVEALTFQTQFTCCQSQAARAAAELGVRLTALPAEDDYLDVIRRPRFGYGRGANPCVDCRIYMFARARRWMDETAAVLVASGEVVGQRPMSQKKRDLAVIAHHSGLADDLLRPLSARLLPPTRAERAGWVDRQRLYGFSGRGRGPLIALARELGLARIPSPSTGCALTNPQFATRVHDLIQLDPQSRRWDFDLLKLGRHFRLDGEAKLVVGRNETENHALGVLAAREDAPSPTLIEPDGFPGPTALLVGPADPRWLARAVALVGRYGKPELVAEPACRVSGSAGISRWAVEIAADEPGELLPL